LARSAWTDAVVDLVRAGVIQVLALQPDLRAARFLGQALRVIHGRRPADVVLELVLELGDERGIVPVACVLVPEVIERAYQRLGHEDSAIRPKWPAASGRS
jgi:hypothetical protein